MLPAQPGLGPWAHLHLHIPLWVQPVGASTCLGLQVREGEITPELPDPGFSSQADSVQLRLAVAGGAPTGASTWRWPHDHTRGRMQSAQCHTPSREAHQSYRCVWPWSQHHRSLSHTDPARLPVTVTHRHALSLRALTQPGTHCHTGIQPDTHAVIHRHTETYAFSCSLGWKGTPGATVSILLPLDMITSLGPDRGGF